MKTKNYENDGANWIWGVFYYNKNDKRIFPPKRIPWMGWTVNFANWKSILALVVVIAIFFGLMWFIEANL